MNGSIEQPMNLTTSGCVGVLAGMWLGVGVSRWSSTGRPRLEMDDFLKHLESVGVSFVDSAADVDHAKTEDEFHFTAGEYLALHAVSVVEALRFPHPTPVPRYAAATQGRSRYAGRPSVN